MELPSFYEEAVELLWEMDDLIANHLGHQEIGGWAFHFRFDDVLRAAFPFDHVDDLWPTSSWYVQCKSEDRGVIVVDPNMVFE